MKREINIYMQNAEQCRIEIYYNLFVTVSQIVSEKKYSGSPYLTCTKICVQRENQGHKTIDITRISMLKTIEIGETTTTSLLKTHIKETSVEPLRK